MVDNDASRRKIGQRYAENSPPLLRHVDSSDENFGYGWGNIRPGSLHFMNHPICFLIVMMLLTTTQGTAILGIFTVVLPQIEKRFSLSSTDIGLIAAANDAAALILGLFISYYGDFANKIKWISLGGIISGVGFILFTFPHFIAGKYNPPATLNVGLAMCVVSNGTSSPQDQCPEGAAVQWYYMAIFCITQFIAGAGTLPLYSLTPAYIAENVSAKRTPIYMGFWYLSTFLGPLLGFGLADPLSKLYVDIDQPEGVNLTPKDPRWIGNWWAGFLGCGFFMILFSLVLLGFPKHLVPKEKEERKKDINIEVEKSNPHIASLRKRIKKTMVDFIASSKELMTNVTFLCNCMAMNITMFVQEGIAPFIAKTLFLKYGVGIGNLGKSLVICTTPGMISNERNNQ